MDTQIQSILSGILAHCCPKTVILYGEKRSISTNTLKSLDFCVIIPDADADKNALLRTLYLTVDETIPFNVLVYTCDEWDELTQDFSSYASAICKKGTVLYEQNP